MRARRQGPARIAFTFAVNGVPVATFRSGRTPDDRGWSVTGLGRRRAVVQNDPYRHVRRTVRVHVGDRAPVAVWHGRPAVLGDGRGRRQPGLLSRPRGAGAEFCARARGAGGVRIGRASRPRRDQQRARSRGACASTRAGLRSRPKLRPGTRACSFPQARTRDRAVTVSITAGQRRARRSDDRAEDRAGPRAPPAAPLSRGHRLLGPAARGRAQAVEEPARRGRARPGRRRRIRPRRVSSGTSKACGRSRAT